MKETCFAGDVKAAREPKHAVLDAEIGRLTVVLDALDKLSARILQGPQCEPGDCAVTAASLVGVLEDGPDRISTFRDCALSRIRGIEDLLF